MLERAQAPLSSLCLIFKYKDYKFGSNVQTYTSECAVKLRDSITSRELPAIFMHCSKAVW